MIFLNYRVLWVKNLTETIEICRRQRSLTSMFRIPDINRTYFLNKSIGKLFIREINAINLPLLYRRKTKFLNKKKFFENNSYCIIEINNTQRQTTPILYDTFNLQWNILFEYFITNIQYDLIKCFIYNRSQYTTDRKIYKKKFRFFFF